MPNFKEHINPIFKDLDSLLDFKNTQKKTKLLKEEYPYLEKTTSYLGKKVKKQYINIEKLNEQLEKIIIEIEHSTGDDKQDSLKTYNQNFTKLLDYLQTINLELDNISSPYFGKIIFQRQENDTFREKEITSYIGKFGIFDSHDKKILVTDWRAPIANLYYKNTGPIKNIKFDGPTSVQEGDLIQKRQFEINRARINKIYDVKAGTLSADEFLIAQLDKRIGIKLTEIVSTIQEQQNNIIREDINKPVIIQGVAGSGKTTILLHKLAYLLFTYQKEINPKNSIIIAPNMMFLDYISDVLPSLGIQNLEHNTFLFWGKKILGWDSKYILSTIEENLEIKKYKGSYKFKLLIQEYFESFESHLLENIPSSLKYMITERYTTLKREHKNISMKERLELSLNYAINQKQLKTNLKEGYIAPIGNEATKRQAIKDYINKKCDPFRIYRNMFDHIKDSKYIDKVMIEKIKKHHKKALATERNSYHYKIEDLAAILWIHFQVFGIQEHIKDYVMVDEAQDLSPFQLLILKQIAKHNNITIAGDIAQSITPPFHIQDWEEIISMYKTDDSTLKELSYHQLNTCYRTTIEVINYANKILKKHFSKKYKLPEAILRHGKEVEIVREDGLKQLIQIIKGEIENNTATIAVMCKDIHHANKLYKDIKEKFKSTKSRILSHKEDNYEGGVLILPIAKAKGLEFDTVIIAEMTKKRYQNTELDIRLLYVAVTRALHKLYIHTPKEKGKRSELLNI